MKQKVVALLGIFFLTSVFSVIALSKQSWPAFLKEIRQEAIAQGIRPEVVDSALSAIKAPNRKVLHYDRTQPEKRLTFLKYRNTRAGAYRIQLGQRELRKYRPLLQQISRRYGVSECFIVSLWGLETSYGRFMGSFPVIHSR